MDLSPSDRRIKESVDHIEPIRLLVLSDHLDPNFVLTCIEVRETKKLVLLVESDDKLRTSVRSREEERLLDILPEAVAKQSNGASSVALLVVSSEQLLDLEEVVRSSKPRAKEGQDFPFLACPFSKKRTLSQFARVSP